MLATILRNFLVSAKCGICETNSIFILSLFILCFCFFNFIGVSSLIYGICKQNSMHEDLESWHLTGHWLGQQSVCIALKDKAIIVRQTSLPKNKPEKIAATFRGNTTSPPAKWCQLVRITAQILLEVGCYGRYLERKTVVMHDVAKCPGCFLNLLTPSFP